MLGIDDPGVWVAYLLCIFSTIFCIFYGIFNWNQGDETVYPEDLKWVKDEAKVDEEL